MTTMMSRPIYWIIAVLFGLATSAVCLPLIVAVVVIEIAERVYQNIRACTEVNRELR